jgi:6-pyruvoyltetrahydropterin/6-carboxytetrahydropterin synthase
MYTIAKRFAFSASHQLDHLPEGHQCARLHGHNYEVELILRAVDVDERGFVVDYGDLQPFGNFIAAHLDHRHLNEALPCITTAENIAKFLYDVAWDRWHHVTITVRVSETPKTWAEYTT